MTPFVRPMVLSDLDAVLDIQRACYGEGFLEGADVITRRIGSSVGLSCVAEREGRVCAYLAAYRSHPGKLTPLHGDFEAVSEPFSRPDTLYLHDLAVHPDATGLGLAQALVRHLWAQGVALGLTGSALVSVQGSQDFWARLGYQVQALGDPVQQQRLASYGEGACYMVRTSLA